MRLLSFTLVMLMVTAVSAATDEVAGTWKTTMVIPESTHIPLVRYEPVLQFRVNGNTLKGMAVMDDWPGDAPISEGKVDGNRVTFTLVHQQPYKKNHETFYTAFRCEGTIRGNEMDLIMNSVDDPGRKYSMKGTRISQ